MSVAIPMDNLPKIPGMGFGEELLRTNYRKSQLLNLKTGVQDRRPKPDLQQFDTQRLSNTQLAGQQPKRLTLDRKVLRFQAFFKEGVHESPLERERIRKCIVCYFLEDDTISVTEPKQDNSGIPGQGSLIKRHQIPRPDGSAYSFEEFNIGQSVSLYGKTFYLIDCDAFTRKFLTGLGISVPEPEDFPDDQYTEVRKQASASMVPRKAKYGDDVDYLGSAGRRSKLSAEEISSTKQFLANENNVFRFYCVWDDRNRLYGDVRLFTIHYFLADDTIEVTEANPPNCGRDPFPSFIKRSKVPRQPIENTYTNPNVGLSFKKQAVECLSDADLRIGEHIIIFGRPFLIYDCDEFTKRYLVDKFGDMDFTPIDVSQPGPQKTPVEPPPYNGFGDEEDSLGSWKYLVPQPPKKDVRRFMEHSNDQLKFQLQMEGGDTSNAIRKFVLTFYLADNTLSIFEPAIRNSGILGGKFLQRQKVKKVGLDGIASGEYISATDLFVGAKLTINTHRFVVTSTDERTLSYMETNPGEFPRANIDTIITKLRSMLISRHTGLRDAFQRADIDGDGLVNYEVFASIIEKLQLNISEHEVLILMRFFDRMQNGNVSWTQFMETVLPPQTQAQYSQLRDQTWEEIERIAEQVEADALDKFKSSMTENNSRLNQITDQSVREFIDRFNQRRVLFQDTFKTVADHSPDGCIGEAEFRKAVQGKLKLGLSENALKAICLRLFPESLRRIPLFEFLRVLNGNSTYVHFSTTRK